MCSAAHSKICLTQHRTAGLNISGNFHQKFLQGKGIGCFCSNVSRVGAISLISLQGAHSLPQVMKCWHWISVSSQLKWHCRMCHTFGLKPFVIPLPQFFLQSVQHRDFCFYVFFLTTFLIFRSSALQKADPLLALAGLVGNPFICDAKKLESSLLGKRLCSC